MPAKKDRRKLHCERLNEERSRSKRAQQQCSDEKDADYQPSDSDEEEPSPWLMAGTGIAEPGNDLPAARQREQWKRKKAKQRRKSAPASISTATTIASFFRPTVAAPAAATTPTPSTSTASKKYARRHCGYSLSALRVCVPIALSQTLDDLPAELRLEVENGERKDLPVSPLFKQRRWARISRQYMIEFRKGETGHAVVRAVAAKRSARHRDTSDARSRPAEAAMEAAAFREL
mmetsp:Transcript_22928/g.58312  ORF Transcript_22928/g.58312 Transcript_22928/m.58312 type:complete len:233 (-) Transcript_22928:77-775(-)